MNLSRLGFAVALGAEARALGALHPDWMIEVSGIGAEAAATAARKLIHRGCEAIVSWGIAGGLSAELAIGDLVLPDEVRGGELSYAVDGALRSALAQRLGGRIHGGVLITTEEVIRTPHGKVELHRRHGAVAVDMESAAIARVAAESRLAFVAVRAISDEVSHALPRGMTVAVNPETGTLRPGGVARLLLTRPHLLPHLVRTGRHVARALSTLSAAAHAMRDIARE